MLVWLQQRLVMLLYAVYAFLFDYGAYQRGLFLRKKELKIRPEGGEKQVGLLAWGKEGFPKRKVLKD